MKKQTLWELSYIVFPGLMSLLIVEFFDATYTKYSLAFLVVMILGILINIKKFWFPK